MRSNRPSPSSWSSVGRWTIIGTLACIVLSVCASLMLMGTRETLASGQVIAMSAIMPTVMGGPLFLYCGMRMRQLRIDNHRLGRVARTDSLTACLNRGAFTARVDEWLGLSVAQSEGALLIIDADNFKAINDLYGHQAGDEALTIIARSIRAVLRSGDLVGRMGGEEFAVFLPDVNHDEAAAIAERIRRAVNLASFSPAGHQHSLSVSIGGAVFAQTCSFSDLFRIADQRLYGAKRAGRNVVAVVQAEDHPAINLRRSA
jgi:diguanylate cyclase